MNNRKIKNIINKLINKHTIGLFIIFIISFLIEKKFFVKESIKYTRMLTTILVLFSSYLFVIYNFKIEYDKKNKLNIKYLILNNFTNIKYLFACVIPIMNTIQYKQINYLYFALAELILIYIFTNIISSKYKKIGYLFNGFIILLFVINEFILYFGTTYLSYIMVSNMDSLDLILNKAYVYVPAVITAIVISFLPIKYKKIENRGLITLSSIFIYVLLLSNYTYIYSPLSSYLGLARNIYDNVKMQKLIKEYQKTDYKSEFYNKNISNYIKYNNKMGKNPNIILIFVEGLSERVVTDSRNLMPNMKKLRESSLRFDNYFNHTQATYRGLIGQLYSGYQNNNYDTNSLVSIQSIFKKEGYNTTFINVEPDNKEFSTYLKEFNFDTLVNEYDSKKHTIHDKEAYELLYDTSINLNKENKPFFLSMYSVETHATFNSHDKKFGNGSNAELNKFYNLDYHIGLFIDKFKNSKLYNNTILIVTTDHATYVDNDYYNSFGKNRLHPFVDEIPLYIYHKGVEVKTYDAKLKNSLDLAPTILDYIDKENYENYFLGDSLFASDEGKSKCDRYNYAEGSITKILDRSFETTSVKDPSEFKERLIKYFSISYKN